jgi:predicted thioesterase
MDDEVARREGFAAAFAMAPLTSSYVHAMLRDWLDAVAPGRGRIDGVQVRLRHPFLRGRTLTVAGTVVAVDGERITVEVRADDDHGARVAEGEAVVVVRAG